MLKNPRSPRARRRLVASEPLLTGFMPDYADAFELRLAEPDCRTAEELTRAAFEQAPRAWRSVIHLVHARILMFRLDPDAAPDRIAGWRVVSSSRDLLHMEVDGPLMNAVIIARHEDQTCAVASTFVFFKRPAARRLWAVVAPLHRAVAPRLLEVAANNQGNRPANPRGGAQQS